MVIHFQNNDIHSCHVKIWKLEENGKTDQYWREWYDREYHTKVTEYLILSGEIQRLCKNCNIDPVAEDPKENLRLLQGYIFGSKSNTAQNKLDLIMED
jgi:hypothetical protein